MAQVHSTLSLDRDGRGVLSVRLNRPDVRNAFNRQMIGDLEGVFGPKGVATDPKTRVVTLRGEGAAFCAGGDLNWLKQAVEMSFEKNLEETRQLSKLFATMNSFSKPILGAVHGFAIAGGVGLVSVCDHVVATRPTQFSLSEVRLGIVPACIGPFVIAKIGASAARSLFVTAERFSAQRACEVGLVHEIVENENELDLRIEKLVNQMLECGPHALSAAKKLVLDLSWPESRSQGGDIVENISQLLAHLRGSPEGQEGIRAFLEKRQPKWPSAS